MDYLRECIGNKHDRLYLIHAMHKVWCNPKGNHKAILLQGRNAGCFYLLLEEVMRITFWRSLICSFETLLDRNGGVEVEWVPDDYHGLSEYWKIIHVNVPAAIEVTGKLRAELMLLFRTGYQDYCGSTYEIN